jgi:AcrR family transcriptional regulator
MTVDELPPRRARKLATRQALLDGALRLLEHQSLTSLGLREVTREAGIAPAAFYRHFADLGELGVVLVQESFGSLHALIRDIRTPEADTEDVIRRSVELVAAHVRAHRPHFRFLARERYGAVATVRAAIAAELDSFVGELVEDLARQPEAEGWSSPELTVLARLYVNVLMLTAAAMVEVGPGDSATEESIVAEALIQLRLITVGRRHWIAER